MTATAAAPTLVDTLLAKAKDRTAVFGVVGLGYVGLPLAMELVRAGYRVLGFDVNARVVDSLNGGHSHIQDVLDASVEDAVQAKQFSATADLGRLKEPDVISISVWEGANTYENVSAYCERRWLLLICRMAAKHCSAIMPNMRMPRIGKMRLGRGNGSLSQPATAHSGSPTTGSHDKRQARAPKRSSQRNARGCAALGSWVTFSYARSAP